MIVKEKINYIEHLVAPDKAADFFSFFKNIVDRTKYQLIRLKISGKEELNIQIMAEDKNRSMVIEDCKILSNIIVDEIELAEDFNHEYVLEVSSGGLARPLTLIDDYESFKHSKAKIVLKEKFLGKKTYKGFLKGIDKNGKILLETDNHKIKFNFLEIEKANIDPNWAIKNN